MGAYLCRPIPENIAETRCAELAVSARSEQLKAALLQLSKNWEQLAIDLENCVAMLDEVEVVSSEICLSVDEWTLLNASYSVGFDRRTGEVTGRIVGDLPAVTFRLVFSADGRYLVAVIWRGRTSI